jgi:RND family efflux transporter MFP subunit
MRAAVLLATRAVGRQYRFARGRTSLIGVIGAVVVTACSPPPASAPHVPAVFVSTVRHDSGATQRVLPGSLRPRVESAMSFRAGGKVLARSVELGQTVRVGEVLGRIDAEDYELAVQAAVEQQRAAEVDAAQAARDAARLARLLASGASGAADVERQQARADAAAARLAQAQRQAELARNRAGHATLTAPFDGIVTEVRFEAGQTVNEGQPVLSLAVPDELELEADLPEALVAELTDWQASATVGNGTQAIALTLRELSPIAAAGTRTFRARYALGPLPPDATWRMGMTAELRLKRPGHVPGAELPVSALLATGVSEAAVWLVDAGSGALQRMPVRLLAQTTDHVRVAGLPEGALVVSVGGQKLDAGMKVRPVPRPLVAFERAATAPR